jgi:hypothetical protein
MVTGTQWPGGDPFLQRQNEPSMAISSRNPLHMVAGANDYRTVDLPAVSGEAEPTGDAWLGFFTSFDGGKTWTSTLVPGYPQDQSLQGVFSPIHGLGAGADPTVRAGTNGMFYYSGIAFNRQAGGASKVFVAAYTDDNNLEGGNSIRYLWTTAVDTGTSNLFEDKPSIAVDIPRSWSGACVVPALPLQNTQIFRAGTVYAAWTQFTGEEENGNAAIMYSHSIDCGLTWSKPQQISGTAKTNQGAALAIDPNTGALYITWRVFASTSPTQADSLWYVASFDGGNTFTKATLITNISPFDQGDTDVSFRTNDYPTITVDEASHVYVGWAQRGAGLYNDARIQVITGIPTANPKSIPLQWSSPIMVDPLPNTQGHQVMPAMAFSAGKLTVAWYDFRDDDLIAVYAPTAQDAVGFFTSTLENECVFSETGGCAQVPAFGEYIQDPAPGTTPPIFGNYPAGTWRQTVEVRAAQAAPGNPPSFNPSVQVTSYPYGSVPPITPTSQVQQLQTDPPNLPMFQSGTLPFFGDYIDVAGPTFIPNSNGTWRFNNLPTDPDFTHVVWTDNRDVVPPFDGNWANYTPPTYGTSTTSIFDSTQQRPACVVSTNGATTNTGDRNQNIYTAQLSPGLGLSAPGNAKQLGTSNGQLIQRQFPIIVSNTTAVPATYTLTINSQPTGGVASFLQSAVAGEPYPLTSTTVQVPPLSNMSRAVFMTSTSAQASVTVTATGGGQTATVTINPDPNNPPSADTNIATQENYTPTIATPNIANPNIANPNIANPNIANPNIANPNIANPNIANPNIANPNIANPNIANPNIANPNIANTALSDGTITDGTWAVTNTGNTSSAYAVNVLGQIPPAGVTLQLIVYGNYTTPIAQQCNLGTQSHFVPVANITNVTFTQLQNLLQPAALNPTLPGLALAPGQTAYITLRVYDSTTNNPAVALAHYNPITQTSPAVVSQGANTGSHTPPVTLTIVPISLPQATLTGAYPSQTLQATGGSGAYTWSIVSGAPPTGITLSAAGVLTGTPTVSPGVFSFTVQVKDAAGDVALLPLTLTVNPAAPTITSPSSGFSATSPVLVSGNALATAGITVYDGGTQVATTTATAGAWSVPVPLSVGTGHSLTATQTLNSVTSAASAPAVMGTIAPLAPSISSPSSGFSTTSPVTVSGTSAAGATTIAVLDNGTQVGTATPSGTTWSTNVTLSVGGGHSLTATQTVNGVASAPSTPAVTGTILPPVILTSITVAPVPHTSYNGDTVWMNYDWPGQGTVLYSGGSGTVTPSGTTLTASSNGVSVTVTGSNIAVTFPGGWNFDTSPVSLDGLAITDPLATITGVSLASTNIPGFTGSASQLFFDGNDVYINFPHPAFSSLNAGAQVSVNVQFSASAPAPPYALPVGTMQQFTATGNYSNSTTQNLTGLVTWGTTANGVASINSSGLATVLTTGATNITATDGIQGAAAIVSPALVSIAITPGFPSITGTNTQQFTATGTYSDASTQNLTGSVTWASSATGVATIGAGTGLAAGVAMGTTTISATLGGVTGTMLLSVNPLTVTAGTFPNGQFLTPYAQAQIPLTVSGGTAPYSVSLVPNGVVPAGMALAAGTTLTASLSGTPAQAGMWQVPVLVTDSSTPTALTQTVNVPLTIGLATAYAGGSNCYMPYPSTPMYYLSNGTAGPWSVTAPGSLSGELTFLGAGTVTVAGYVSTNGTAVTWVSDTGGQNDQFYASPAPSSIMINGTTYTVASVNSATSLTLTTSAGSQTFVPYSYTIPAGGNTLTGCLSGVTSSGSYQLQLTAGTFAFTLPLQVVAQDTQDNGTVNVNSEGVGNNVPPSGFQQGVVTSGQSFNYLPGSYGPDPSFSGNLLAGFAGTAPQFCATSLSGTMLTAASQAGRYDIAIDGTTQSCPIAAFPTSPAPIVFESVDTLASPAVWGSATITRVVLSSGNPGATAAASNVLEIESGGTSPNPVTVAFNYTINDSGCPGCIDQLQVGLNSEASPQTSAYSGGSSGSGSAILTINVPNTPGRYYIAIDTSEDYGFLYSSPYWWNGPPRPVQYIGVVDVW